MMTKEDKLIKPIKYLCTEYGLNQTELSRRFGIPLRTIQNWHTGVRIPPSYVIRMMDELLKVEELQKPKKLSQPLEVGEQIGGYCPNCGGTVLMQKTWLKEVKGHHCSWCGQCIEIEK